VNICLLYWRIFCFQLMGRNPPQIRRKTKDINPPAQKKSGNSSKGNTVCYTYHFSCQYFFDNVTFEFQQVFSSQTSLKISLTLKANSSWGVDSQISISRGCGNYFYKFKCEFDMSEFEIWKFTYMLLSTCLSCVEVFSNLKLWPWPLTCLFLKRETHFL